MNINKKSIHILITGNYFIEKLPSPQIVTT